jgi:transposase
MTNRLRLALQALGLATGAEESARLAPKLGMQVAPTTLLHFVRKVSPPVVKTVRVLGLDDWADIRGQIYGTISVDLERHRAIDLLPDRSKETAKAWLCTHPEIEVISRDRASNYSDASLGKRLPKPCRWPIDSTWVANIREKIKDVLDRNRSYLPLVKNPATSPTPPSQANPPEENSGAEDEACPQEKEVHSTQEQGFNQADGDPASPRPLTVSEQRRQLNRDKRYALYEKVKDLRKQDLSHYAIADTPLYQPSDGA